MRKWLPLLAICLGSFMLILDTTVVTVAIPDIARDLTASLPAMQWVLNLYTLVLAALTLVAGSLADLVGRRRVYLVALTIFAAGSLGSGLATSAGMLIAMRGVQGVGAAAVFATGMALLASRYEGRDRGTALGTLTAVLGMAAALGLLAGGLLTQFLGWRAIFLVNVPLCLVTGWLAVRCFEADAPAGRAGLDLRGVATLLRRPAFLGLLVAVAAPSLLFAAPLYASVWLQSGLGLSPVGAGLVLVPMAAVAFVTSMVVGRRLHQLPKVPLITTALVVAAIGCGMVRVLVHDGWPGLIPGLMLMGVGIGISGPAVSSALFDAVPAERAGLASGVMATFRQLGQAVGVAVLGLAFVGPTGASVGTVYLVAGAVLLASGLVVTVAHRQRRPARV
ncbi:MFS transporter [Tenggerimyces flavus]|uniref:MFS transporter n=1 Tax=Tenggerimyces flavus TaxID=1708749 RepID=A0ABV7YGF5_9ACTN|nr:MFS transporter [Tenggerimyces flavus]MBM7787268.1 MFS family permease [Tenggerimyces flavus]